LDNNLGPCLKLGLVFYSNFLKTYMQKLVVKVFCACSWLRSHRQWNDDFARCF
uniref:Ovule protein n=1 Tax=Heligmosomoides polygyrus TaxID=6339 RepID=A0A183F3Z0_HELPZ